MMNILPLILAATIQSAPLGDIPMTTSVVTNGITTLNSEVESIYTYLNGQDARFVVTNYDSAVHMPEAYVCIKQSNEWLTVWHETTQITNLEAKITANTDLIATKADRAWGQYDSTTGAAVPDQNYTWISSPKVAIAGGLAWQRVVTSSGSVNVLTSNGLITQNGTDTNGYFRITDESGNTQFEIVRGDERIVGASADGCTKTDTGLQVVYNITAPEHPTMTFATSLDGTWYAEGSAGCPAKSTWSGKSGAWTNDIACTEAQLFAFGEYKAGGSSYIRNALPTAMSSLILNGTTYKLGTAVIDGHTVLTLEVQ